MLAPRGAGTCGPRRQRSKLTARAPLMMHVPGVRSAGRQCDGLVEFVDMYPTPMRGLRYRGSIQVSRESHDAVAGGPPPVLEAGSVHTIPRPYLASQDWEQMGYSMRTDRYRYTEWVDRSRTARARELYDFRIAPTETVNLAGLPSTGAWCSRCPGRCRPDGGRPGPPEPRWRSATAADQIAISARRAGRRAGQPPDPAVLPQQVH